MAVLTTTKIKALLAALRGGDVELLDYLKQVQLHFEAIDPSLKAFVAEDGRFERLNEEAAKLLAQYPEAEERPALFGLPVGIKDIFHTEGFETQAGSQVPAEALRGEEAESVRKLKEAGALIQGKTVTTEFAYFAPGPTRNPHNPEHTPGGSSSGSAAAVGAGLCTLALGTQTIGSVTRPAAFCGVYGFKPSYDRISKEGVIPLSQSLDHVGLFASDLSGAKLVASILCTDWKAEGVRQERPVLGVPDGPYLARASAEGRKQFEAVCEGLVKAGMEVRRVEAMSDFEEIEARHQLIVATEAAQTHEAWYGEYEKHYHPRTAELIQRGQDVKEKEYQEALSGRPKLRAELTSLMEAEGIDLWIAPSAPGAAPKGLESTGDPIMNLPWTQSGLPSLNLLSGFSAKGLPFGLQVVGRWYEDENLFQGAAQIDSVLKRGWR